MSNVPIVRLPQLGLLRGSTTTTKWTKRSVYQFLGVPYGEAPSGKRRFKVNKTEKVKRDEKLFQSHQIEST